MDGRQGDAGKAALNSTPQSAAKLPIKPVKRIAFGFSRAVERHGDDLPNPAGVALHDEDAVGFGDFHGELLQRIARPPPFGVARDVAPVPSQAKTDGRSVRARERFAHGVSREFGPTISQGRSRFASCHAKNPPSAPPAAL